MFFKTPLRKVSLLMLLSGVGLPVPHITERLVGQDHDCAKWQSIVRQLPAEKTEELNKFGITNYLNVVVGSRIADSCHDRLMLGLFIDAHVSGVKMPLPAHEWAVTNQSNLGKYIRELWPLLSDIEGHLSDGAFTSEVYSVLRDPILNDKDVSAIIGEEVKTQGVGVDLLYVMWTRPIDRSSIVPSLRSRLHTVSSDENALEYFAIMMLLRRYGESVTFDLDDFLQNSRFSGGLREAMKLLIDRIMKGEDVSFDDVADLYYK